jgi:hypothetical protein
MSNVAVEMFFGEAIVPMEPPADLPIPTDDLVLWLDASEGAAPTNLAVGQIYSAELGSTSGADAQDPSTTSTAGVDVWDPDASDDHIDTDYTPSFTATTGGATFVFIGVYDSTDTTATFPRALSAESSTPHGINMSYGGAATQELWTTVTGATTLQFRRVQGLGLTDGDRFMMAAVVDDGTLRIYHPSTGLSDPVDITGVGTITFGDLRFFRPTPDAIADRASDSPMQAAMVYERALTEADLDDIAAVYDLSPSEGEGPEPTVGAFRTQQDLAYSGSPEHVLTALGYTSSTKIARADLDGILDDWVAGTGGTTHNVTSAATWTSAMAAVEPGDLVRVTSGFDPGGAGINARGSRYSISSSNLTASPAGGEEGLPIILTCADGEYVDENDTSSNEGVLDIQNCQHVWAVGFNVRDGQFGIRCQNWGGTSGFPAYVAYCNIENIGHAALTVAGWFQLITSSGGTPPAGTGNEWGFSQYGVLESNTIDGAGVIADQFGEGIYLGRGSNPGWVSYARDLWIRGNDVTDWTSDGIDCKPGCSRIYLTDNAFHTGHAEAGAPLGILYVGAGIDTRPALWDEDAQIWIEGNRVYDSDLTNTDASSVHIMGYLGLSGIRIANNIFWAHPQTGTHATWRARMEHGTNDTNALSEYRADPTWIINNTCWGDDSFENAGYGVPFVGTIPAGVTFDLRNNIVDDASPATGEVDAAGSDFVGTVPAIGVAGDADDGGGPGSAFDLDPGSSLVAAGEDISDITFLIDRDIFNREFSSKTTPNPGAFQPG